MKIILYEVWNKKIKKSNFALAATVAKSRLDPSFVMNFRCFKV